MVKIVRQNFKENSKKFMEVKRKLKEVLGDEPAIEHVGSTAIPNMYGKNIVDILVGVNRDDIEKTAEEIDKLGYFRGKTHNSGDRIFFATKEEETGSGDIHIHLAKKDSERYRNFLLLRKYLLENPEEAKRYAKIKQDISKMDRGSYKATKSPYVDKLLDSARTKYQK